MGTHISHRVRTAPFFHPIIVAGGFVTLFILLLLPAVCRYPQTGWEKALCQNNLKQIGLALHNYVNRHEAFPPAFVPDDAGRPMHSWRVLLLPYFEPELREEFKALYAEYNFSEPWDGPHNRLLIDRMPDVYHCPRNERSDRRNTNYVAIVGQSTAWPLDLGRRIRDITDGTSNTILVTEATGLDIPWTAPRDLEFDLLDFQINGPGGYGISSTHHGGANVMVADGSVRFFADTIAPNLLRDMVTADGGEKVTLP